MEPTVRYVTYKIDRQKSPGGKVRTYDRPQILLSGDLLTAAGFPVGTAYIAERARNGVIVVRRLDGVPPQMPKRRKQGK